MRRIATPLAVVVLAAWVAAAQSSLPATIDGLVEAPIKTGRVAGASVAVARGTQLLVDRGYGFADLQLDVPTPVRAIYEIGSVTKQFTAAAILLLAEDKKLALDDELTKFLPDYPTAGHRVTLRHLLNHTSGIKGYTELPEFGQLMMLKKPKDELVKLFSSKPFDFAPGEDLIYNNSAFFLLGLVIEKVSGQSYADFVKTRLFDKAGMTDSSYCSERTIQKRKVHGYDTVNGSLVLKGYLDHSWPYSAGSLCSTAYDLVLWNRALHAGKVLSADSYRAMITPGTLNDGSSLRYTMGLGVTNTGGRRLISHGGGINGYLSQLDYYPDEDLTIVVLFNTAGPVNPQSISTEIADAILGKPRAAERAFEGDLSTFSGAYTGRGRGGPTSIRIEVRGKQLHFLRGAGAGATDETLKYLGDDTFTFRNTLLRFHREGGKVTSVRLDNVGTNVRLNRAN
ncbi:MAG TPA: serine hydrolase domain-containing protein [Vicinamibacterales bacterium]